MGTYEYVPRNVQQISKIGSDTQVIHGDIRVQYMQYVAPDKHEIYR